MSSASAYLLVFHGSRDRRPWQAVEQLSQLVLQGLQKRRSKVEELATGDSVVESWGEAVAVPHTRSAPILVESACLELGPVPLHHQVQRFALDALESGFSKIQILPLFLLPGVHVKEDIPAELAIAQSQIPDSLTLHLCPHVGSHPRLIHLLPAANVGEAIILLSHGSRRLQGNQPVEQLANQLNALPAYWSVAPTLEVQVKALVTRGYGHIQIIPYFLFAGGITDAIALQVAQLAQQLPEVELRLSDPFGPSPALAELVVDLAADPNRIPLTMAYDC